MPFTLMRLNVGINPTMPQRCEGQRILPPVSVPKPNKEPPDATRAASPDEEPPGVNFFFKGCSVLPKRGLLLSKLKFYKKKYNLLHIKTSLNWLQYHTKCTTPVSESIRFAIGDGQQHAITKPHYSRIKAKNNTTRITKPINPSH